MWTIDEEDGRSLRERLQLTAAEDFYLIVDVGSHGDSGSTSYDIGPLSLREAAKGLRDFAKANPTLVIKGGVLDGKPLDANEIAKLASLESREVLLGKMAGAMLASLSQAVYLLNAPLAQAARLAGALQAKAEQDPSILAGGASPESDSGPAAAEEAPAADAADEAPADEAPAADAAEASDEGDTAEA